MALFSFGKKKKQQEGAPGSPFEMIFLRARLGREARSSRLPESFLCDSGGKS